MAKLRGQLESKRPKSQEDDFSPTATTQREKMHQRDREEELRMQIEILAVEIDDIGAAVNESLAMSGLPNLIRSANQKSDLIQMSDQELFPWHPHIRSHEWHGTQRIGILCQKGKKRQGCKVRRIPAPPNRVF
jgi:hypothetical protein